MYRQFGSSAFFLLVLSAFVSNVGGGAANFFDKDKTTKDNGGSKTANAKTSEAIDDDAQRCAAVEILRRHYGLKEQPPQGDGSSDLACQPSAFSSLSVVDQPWEPGVVLIATVPDPLQSANVLEFDRDIQALQEAGTTAGYDFESIVTEWDLSNLEEPKDTKSGREAEHYRRLFGDQPGAMLFHRHSASQNDTLADPSSRSDSELLLLLLVPESPTYGLNIHAANEALSVIKVLQGKSFSTGSSTSLGAIAWIGPNYSASVYGLTRLAADHSFNAFSGSITSRAAIDALKMVDCEYYRQKALSSEVDTRIKCAKSRLDKEVTALEPDENVLKILRRSGVLGRGAEDSIVLLQEDESTYGSGILLPLQDMNPTNTKQTDADQIDVNQVGARQADAYRIRTFHFPRGISHVRGIFGGQYTNYKPATGESPAMQDKKSLFDLSDVLQQPLDTAPEFSAQTPYSNESELASLASSMEHIKASAIVILATDPLDNLFLARYFRQKDPDARIVLFGAERLLPALRRQYDLDGTIAVTRFPLFEDSYLDTPTVVRHALTFMNSTQEGIFFAALHQINPYPIYEASAVRDEFEQLPTWIAVASGGSFWPLRHLRGSDSFCANDHHYIVNDIPEEPLPRLWTICTALVLLCATVHAILFLAGGPLNKWMQADDRAWLKTLAKHRILTFYLPCPPKPFHMPEFEREFGRRYWMLVATAQLLLVLSYLLVPAAMLAGRYFTPYSVGELSTFLFSGLAFGLYLTTWLLFGWLLTDVLFYFSRFRPERLSHPGLHIILPIVTLLWLGLTLVVFSLRLSDSSDGWTFALRCVHLASGVSPVLPLLLASMGFITAAIVNLNALALARDRDPQMPEVGPGLLQLAPCKDQLASFIECWGVLPAPQGYVLFFFVAVWLFIVQPQRLFGSLDGAGMTFIFALNVVFGLWTIAWLWVRFVCIWSLLRFVLETLEGSPLRFAFSRLPKVFSLAPIWSYAGLRRTLILPMRWFEYFRVAPKQYNHTQHLSCERALLEDIAGSLFNDQALIGGDYIAFSRDQNEYATTLAQTLPAVKTSWDRGGPDVEIGATDDTFGVAEHGGIKSRIDVPAPSTHTPVNDRAVAIANEYIAMRLGAYVRYVTLQLKNLMTFMSIGLLLFLLATVSYPFREPRGIAWSLVVLVIFLLFGVGTVLIQMDRDSILSRMSETPPGEVARGAFFWHMLSVGGLPILTALSALFPSIGNFLFSWLQPLLATLH